MRRDGTPSLEEIRANYLKMCCKLFRKRSKALNKELKISEYFNSPNCYSQSYKPEKIKPVTAIVIHHTGEYSIESIVNWFMDRKSKTSAHYLIARDGKILQFVKEENRAWHCGRSNLFGEKDVNCFSIGIELHGDGNLQKYSNMQMAALISIAHALKEKYKIPHNRIVGHCHISPRRKTDPGKFFPWYDFLNSI